MAKDQEIERKFLVRSLPPGFSKLRGVAIEQGYLACDPSREVRVRLTKRKYFLTMKEGTGIARKEVEMPIERKQFETLWPLTEGRRVAKRRYTRPHKGSRVEIDIYEGELAPLRIAEVGFPSIAASGKFVAPPWLGEEITGKPQYYNASLAHHGRPDRSAKDYRIGALPYIVRNGRIHIVIVTNSSGTRWIVPKGQPEQGMSMQDVAMMETVEEAGAIGTVRSGIRGRCKLRDGRTLYVFPLQISTVLAKWPESNIRRREILPLKEALERISDRPLAKCVARLAARLG